LSVAQAVQLGRAASLARRESPKLSGEAKMQTPQLFNEYWDSTYGDCSPIGYLLRNALPERWVRFHSLPESKRYADDESECLIILERQNAVLSALSPRNADLVFISCGYSESVDPSRTEAELNVVDPTAQFWRTIVQNEEDDYKNYWHPFMSVWPWTTGAFDSILRLVADNTIAHTLIVNPKDHWVFHPYDGGVDVILRSVDERNQLKRKFQAWLSQRSDGL
jgi:hypothetical protein